MVKQSLLLLGATGSIGQSTLEIVRLYPERFQVFALTAQRRIDLLFPLIVEFAPFFVVVTNHLAGKELEHRLEGTSVRTKVLIGPAALIELATHPEVDTVLAAIVGAAGLAPTFAAVEAGKRILLANKEALVLAGNLFIRAIRKSGGELIPIDSEHNAIFQCLPSPFTVGITPSGVNRLILTASGGPFRDASLSDLMEVTPAEACCHPNWSMGPKISVDSATMMNKGLELIEAHWLFGVPASQLEVLIHPQSIVHSMVEYLDGSVLAQMGNPDMRVPIANALAYPERVISGVPSLNLVHQSPLQFYHPDFMRFPALKLAFEALESGGSACAFLNAANEVAVAAFLNGKLSFPQITSTVERILERLPNNTLNTLADALAADRLARTVTSESLGFFDDRLRAKGYV